MDRDTGPEIIVGLLTSLQIDSLLHAEKTAFCMAILVDKMYQGKLT